MDGTVALIFAILTFYQQRATDLQLVESQSLEITTSSFVAAVAQWVTAFVPQAEG